MLNAPTGLKRYFFLLLLLTAAKVCNAQANLISYDDVNYLLHNNIAKADSFFVAKGYTLVKKNEKKNLREYKLSVSGGTYVDANIRADGKRIFMEIVSTELAQYTMIYNSIEQYVDKRSTTVDVQAFKVKDLGDVYIMVNDVIPYNPTRREYYIRIVSDKSITAYN